MNAQQAISRSIEALEWRARRADEILANDGHWISSNYFGVLTDRAKGDKEAIEALRTYYPEVVEK